MIHLILHNIKRRAPAAVRSFDLVVHSFTRTLTDRGTTDRLTERRTDRQTDRQTDTDGLAARPTNKSRQATCKEDWSGPDGGTMEEEREKTGADQMEGRWKRSIQRQMQRGQ